MKRRTLKYLMLLVLIPILVLGGSIIFHDKQYAWISLCVVVASCIPFILSFEKGKSGTSQMILIAVMTAISVMGRILFAPVPGFKPVSAIVIITAMNMGAEAGFMTGSMSAVISNFYFGQGPWTPFQMFVWGLIGLLAGILKTPLKKNRWLLLLYGVFAGILFSMLMDVWTVLWWDGTFSITRYLAAIVSAVPYTVVYAVSNVIFLFIMTGPIGGKLERIKYKYGL